MNLSNPPKSILLKLPVKIGDTIMAGYVIRGIKEQFPNARLDVIMAELTLGLAPMFPWIDGIHSFSKKKYPGPIGNYKYGKMIAKNHRYDLFICLPFSFSSAMAGYFTRSKIRTGFSSEHRGFLFNKPVKHIPGLHVAEEFNYVFEHLINKKIKFRPLALKPSENQLIDYDNKKYMVFNITSGPESRRIPVKKAIDLLQLFLSQYSFDIVIPGAPNEVERIQKVTSHFAENTRVIDLSGKSSLMEAAYLFSRAEVMVTTDSGNAHVANAVGTPTVVLFGAGEIGWSQPYDKSISRNLINSELPCISCKKEHCKMGDNRCLSTIENSAVLEAIKDLLSAC